MKACAKFLLINHAILGHSAAVEEFDVEVDGTLFLTVVVEGSPVPSERILLDTGSKHTWIYHNKELERIYRGRVPDGANKGGFRTDLISRMTFAPLSGRHIQYADQTEIRCDRWTRKVFSIGSHKWEQKFGIARGNVKNREPRYSGLIGAGPGSIFATAHPQFSFRPVDSHSMKLYFGPIDPTKCEGGKVGYVSLTDNRHWTTTGSLQIGSDVRFNDVHMAVDTGASVFAFPHQLFDKFAKSLVSRGIRYKYIPERLVGIVDCHDMPLLPPIEIHSRNGFKITIPYQLYIRKSGDSCTVLVASISNSLPIVLGKPVFLHFNVEFDSTNKRVGICKPLGGDMHGHMIDDIPYPAEPEPEPESEPVQEFTHPPRLPDDIQEGPYDFLSTNNARSHFAVILLIMIILCM